MPNWCMNHLELQHDDVAALDRVKTALESEGIGAEFCPPEDPDLWYGWNVDHLGTKWDFTSDDVEIDGNVLHCSFDTAWSPPITLMDLLTELGYTCSLHYYEPGMNFIGTYVSGFGEEYYNDVNDAPGELRDYWNVDDLEWEEEDGPA